MNSLSKLVVSLALFMALVQVVGVSPAAGQTAATGQIVGTITDPSKAAVASATVTVTNEATGVARTVKTTAEGDYVVPLLPPGTYSVTVEAPGFKTQTSPGILVQVASTATVNIRLQLGGSTEKVIVEASAEILQTESAANGGVVNDRTVPALPLSSRNYTQILDLSPGVSGSVPNAASLGKNSVDVFVNGGRIMDNSYQMDGQDAGNMETQGTGSILSIGGISIPNPDAIQEFKVQTSLYDASYGRGAGGNVNVVTKSGSDQLHGALFEFLRNDVFNANDFFLNRNHVPRPPLKQSQFGGTIGGHIIKSKLFYFGSYQGTRQINGVSSNSVATAILPGLTNDRSATGIASLFGGLQGADGGTIAADGSNINPVALKLLNLKVTSGGFLVPTPQAPTTKDAQNGPQGTSSFSSPSKFNENQYIVNVDYSPNSKHTISEKFFYAKSPEFLAFTSSNVPGSGTNDLFRNWNGIVKETYLITPTLINEASAGYHRYYGRVASQNQVTNQSIGLTPGCTSPFMPIMVIGSMELSGNFNDGQFTAPTSWVGQDQISWTHGKHDFRAGFGWEKDIADSADQEVTRGDLVFPSFEDFLLGMSAAQLGNTGPGGSNLSSLLVSDDLCGDTTRAFHVSNLYSFAQDDIKLNPHLTVNLGLRWEGVGQTSDGAGKLVDFWPTLASNDLANQPFSGFIAASNFQGALPSGIARNGNPTFAKNAWAVKNFGPRLGFAWTPSRFTEKIVVRGGYGIYFTHPPVNDAFQLIVNPPFFSRQTNIGALNALATLQVPFNPPSNEVFPNFVPRTATSALTINSINPNWQTPRTQQWSLGIQYAIDTATTFQIGYVGTHSDRIETTNSINQALLASPGNPVNGVTANTVANAVNRVPVLGIAPSGLNQAEWIGISNYNGLQVNVQRRLSRGLQFGVAYTYSKTLTDVTGVGTFPLGGGAYNDQLNPMDGYGPADFDTRHRFVANYLWNLPNFRDNQGFAGKALSGWGVSGVVVVQSGPALTFTDPGAGTIFGFGGPFSPVGASLCPGKTAADIKKGGSVESTIGAPFGMFNNVFCPAPAIGNGTGFGTLGRGIIYGPGQHNMDMSIFKDFKVGGLSEAGMIQFRTEFFNTFNTPQFASQTTTQFSTTITQIGAPTFGQVTATTVSPRIIQFGLKYTF
ncbi:MAG: carboxypeptidase regulatory-like domain-containing protein [Acidobacteria bacterium]|nr:MAG: carboxypeptidase regulatory-like domain-containing protein [Acidobacteriota bacterium]